MKQGLFILVFTVLMSAYVHAEDSDIIYLPNIEVVDNKDTGDYIDSEDIERAGAQDLTEAIKHIPGILITGGGARNESNFRIRGFGVDSVPVYVDGIALANPYRRSGDAARLLVGDLESITIHKGYSSPLLGANNLGGAIVMRTAKPKNPLELSLNTSFDFDSIFKYASSYYSLSAGTRQNLFYTKATFQYRGVDHYRLSGDFEPNNRNPQQYGDRLWSDSIDRKLTFIAGLTPTSSLDLWLAYIYQNADKGVSPPDTVVRDFQVWEWPVWKRQSISLNSAYDDGIFALSLLAYYDKYDNSMLEYYDIPSLEAGVYAGPSDYDEFSAGLRLQAGWQINETSSLKLGLAYKREDHKGFRKYIKEIQVNEDLYSVGLEYSAKPFSRLHIALGSGFDMLVPQRYWGDYNEFAKKLGANYYIVKTDTMWTLTAQAGLFYSLTDTQELRLTYARKNHFPTMSERYSTRFGDVLPNPSLGPEVADHFELGWKGGLPSLRVNASVYYSFVTDKIVNIQIPNPDDPKIPVDYARNLDKSAFYGAELGLKYLHDKVTAGLNFSYNKYSINHNQNNDIKVISYYPEITSNAYIEFMPTDSWLFSPSFEYMGSRYTGTSGREELEAYTLVNFRADYIINEHLKLSARIHNIFDEFYEIQRFSPMAGRTYSLSLSARY